MLSSSVVLFIVSYQHLGVVWLTTLIHAIISDLGLESSFSRSKGHHLHIFLIRNFLGYRTVLSPGTRNNDVRKSSVLGTFYIFYTRQIFSLTSHVFFFF